MNIFPNEKQYSRLDEMGIKFVHVETDKEDWKEGELEQMILDSLEEVVPLPKLGDSYA